MRGRIKGQMEIDLLTPLGLPADMQQYGLLVSMLDILPVLLDQPCPSQTVFTGCRDWISEQKVQDQLIVICGDLLTRKFPSPDLSFGSVSFQNHSLTRIPEHQR